MNVPCSRGRVLGAVRRPSLCSSLSSLSLANGRSFSSSVRCRATPTLHPTTRRDGLAADTGSVESRNLTEARQQLAQPSYKDLSPAQRAAQAAQRARAKMLEQQEKYSSTRQLGGLTDNNVFHDDEEPDKARTSVSSANDLALAQRNISAMSFAIDPRPNARARWQRKMVIRHVRRRGRLPKQVQIDRTERYHLSKSHFFKTSMKKLAPLARQIAGKSIDEAILQMRFSKKKAAIDVREHLIQARDEAVVLKGMGIPTPTAPKELVDTNQIHGESAIILDPSVIPAPAHQYPTKTVKPGATLSPTEIYIAQAWVNRGPYGMEPEYRARGRVNILRPPWTGISVLLKEEKTRTREKADKEEKSIRRRTGKSMWTQLPDRPIVRQSQYVLW